MGLIATAAGLVAEQRDAHVRAAAGRRAHDRYARLARAATDTQAARVVMSGDAEPLVTGGAGAADDDAAAVAARRLADDVLAAGRTIAARPAAATGAALGVPVVHHGETIGACCVADTRDRDFDAEAVEAVADVAELLARDLDRVRERARRDRRERWERHQRAVLEAVAGGVPLGPVLDLLLTGIEAYSDELLCSVLLLDDDGVHIRHGSAPRLAPEYVAAIDGVEIGPSVGSCGTAMYIGEQVIVEDIATDPLWRDYRELALGHGLQACWSTPIFGPEGQVFGSFAVYYRRPRRPDREDLDLVHRVSDLASIAISRARHEQAMQDAAALAAARAAEHAALQRVATAVAREAGPEELFTLVARETTQLIGADAGAVGRYVGEDEAVLAGAWGGDEVGAPPVGERYPLSQTRLFGRLRGADGPQHLPREDGQPAILAAPVRLGDATWGAIGMSRRARDFDDADARRLAAFAELVATAVANAAAQERLTELASTDALTGLANHRVLLERLRSAVAAARRHDGNVAVAVFDLDGFKEINDTAGHPEGSAVLAELAALLRPTTREGDLLARLGGDEFALLMPGADVVEATAAAERMRALVADTAFGAGGHRLTLCGGTCDLTAGGDTDGLLRLADRALYRAKAGGRDRICAWKPAAEPR